MSGALGSARLRWLAWLLAVVCGACWAAPVLAEPAPPRAEWDARGPVEIVLVGELAQDPVFAGRVSSWFALGQLRVVMRKASSLDPKQVLTPSPDAGAHVWVTFDGHALARLYFASARSSSKDGPSYFVRELRLEQGLDEIGAEHVAEVLNLSTLAFLEGEAESAREELEQTLRAETAVEPPKPAPPETKPAPPSPPTLPAAPGVGSASARGATKRGWTARVGYAASLRADEGVWHGPSAAFEVTLWRKLGLRLAAQAALPSERTLGPLELRFYGASLQLAPSLRHAVAGNVELQAFAGPALELVHYAPVRATNAAYGVGSAATEARPALGLGVGAAWGQAPALAFVAQAALPLTRTHYDVVQAGSREVIGRASLVVPTVGVEIGF